MRKIAADRNTRIVHKLSAKQMATYPKDKQPKDRVYYCRTRDQVIELFDTMIINFGETLVLETLVDGEWILQETKTTNKNKPKVAFQGEYTPVHEPAKGWY